MKIFFIAISITFKWADDIAEYWIPYRLVERLCLKFHPKQHTRSTRACKRIDMLWTHKSGAHAYCRTSDDA